MNCEVYALRGGLPSMAERRRQAGRKLLWHKTGGDG